MRKFLMLVKARNFEFLRDKDALAWNLIFPFLVIFGFAFVFGRENEALFKVMVHPTQKAAHSHVVDRFLQTPYIQFIDTQGTPDSRDMDGLKQAIEKLRRHQVDLVLSVEKSSDGKVFERYWMNKTAPKGALAEKLLLAGGSGLVKETIEGAEIRYVDWLISGLLGMNTMFSALFGVGYVIVRYRKSGVLRRMKAAPLGAFTFLSAQIFSRYLLMIATTIVVYFGSNFFIHYQMLGSYLDLFLVMSIGSICLIALGLLFASRTASEEFAGGMLNLISWPMMFFSGVWFSLDGTQPWVRKIALLFPLTHVIDASRAIMTEGATLMQVSDHVGVLVVMSAVFLAAGSALFRWE